MRIESGRNRIAEKISWNKHVVAAGLLVRDAGSTPAASTIFYKCFVIVVDKTGQKMFAAVHFDAQLQKLERQIHECLRTFSPAAFLKRFH